MGHREDQSKSFKAAIAWLRFECALGVYCGGRLVPPVKVSGTFRVEPSGKSQVVRGIVLEGSSPLKPSVL